MPEHIPGRVANTDRLYAALAAEILPAVPLELWARLGRGGRIDQADQQLVQLCNRYEAGEATRAQVLEAAESLRRVWKEAIAAHRRSLTPVPLPAVHGAAA